MKSGSEYLKDNMENTNIPEEHYEREIGDMMEWYAEYYYWQRVAEEAKKEKVNY